MYSSGFWEDNQKRKKYIFKISNQHQPSVNNLHFFSGSATISIQWLLLSTQQLMHQAINLTTRTSLGKRKHHISFIKNGEKANCQLRFGLQMLQQRMSSRRPNHRQTLLFRSHPEYLSLLLLPGSSTPCFLLTQTFTLKGFWFTPHIECRVIFLFYLMPVGYK